MAAFHEEKSGQQQIRPCPGPVLAGHTLACYEEQHCWIIDQVLLPCSIAEYRCLKLLFEHANTCVPFSSFVSDDEIVPTAGLPVSQERPRIAYLMSKLRGRLWPLGFNLVNVWNVGYILLTEASQEQRVQKPPAPSENLPT